MLLSKAWGDLSNYESQDLIRRRYERRHSGQANAGHAREIKSSLSQAREYFAAASTADRIVKPLLLYYGSIGLARSYVMFNDRRREATLDQSHGLSAKNWTQIFNQDSSDISDVIIEINSKGTLKEFANATSNRSMLRFNSSAIEHVYQHSPILTNSEICLKDMLSRMPDIAGQYSRWKDDTNFYYAELSATELQCDFTFYKQRNHAPVNMLSINSLFPHPERIINIVDNDTNIKVTCKNTINDHPIYSDAYGGLWDIGQLVFLREYPGGGEFSKSVATLIVSYALGMLVRYYPSKWTSIIRGDAGDAALPTILSTIDYIERYFPQMILELFESDINPKPVIGRSNI